MNDLIDLKKKWPVIGCLFLFCLSGCSLFGGSESKWGQSSSKEQSILSLIDGMVGEDKQVKVSRMVQVGVKDGAPVYDFVEEGEDGKVPKQAFSKDYLKAVAHARKAQIEEKREEVKETAQVKELLNVDFEGVDEFRPEAKPPEPIVAAVEKTEEVPVVKKKVAVKKTASYMTKKEVISNQRNLSSVDPGRRIPRLYTPPIVVDQKSQGTKGAVQLVWTKSEKSKDLYEVEIMKKDHLYSTVQSSNVFHIMIYWKHDYLWRVRNLDSKKQPKTAFSEWKPLKVLPAKP